MGRHSKKSDSNVRRNSLVALTGLVPTGVVAATATGAPVTIPLTTAADASPIVATPDVHSEPAPPAATEIVPAPAAEAPVLVSPAAAPNPKPAPAPAPLPDGPLGIPAINFAAYRAAEHTLAQRNPGCGISWQQIAGIGRVESSHANGGRADDRGNLLEPIIGLPLNGSLPGQAVIYDTDGGTLDGDTVYDRAVGPTQFIPTTWAQYGIDGNGDGIADPQNLFDGAASTANYLCDGTDMRNLASATRAILRYNNSMAYVANVAAWSLAYSTGIGPAAADLPRIH